MASLNEDGVDRAFDAHPVQKGQAIRYSDIRGKAKEMARLINGSCPPSRERSLAITNLEQAVMWANKSIAVNEAEE